MNQQSLFISPSFSSDHICVEQNILLIVHRAPSARTLSTESVACTLFGNDSIKCFEVDDIRHSEAAGMAGLTVTCESVRNDRTSVLMAIVNQGS
ncbi:hypothetical protein BLNAU_24690 [Blattamonas nauphoetae]|uniref:Uncharacterized protein n=1 Tax=Blattamonas nauphoetae TaxID=2049346 RepID=A0ABQ9WLQ4_9EUKA|nr:hypothetical protein BLNAU_24690 [Blattamonas nauphoetae]